MKIYSILGVEIVDIPVQNNSVRERELMKSDFIRFEWSQDRLINLPCGSYIVYDNVKYRLLKDYIPEQKNTLQWDYSPEFQHPVMMLGTVPFILITGDVTSWQSADKETEWNWTGTALDAVENLFIPFLNKYGADNSDIGRGWTSIISKDVKASETLSFQSMDFLSALSHAAQQFECEWHLDYENKILYFGHVNITTDELVFEVGENVGNPEVRENNEGYYNAYIAKGSTRNISQVNDKGENIQLNKRLKLDPVKYPDGYIDRRKLAGEPLIVKELIYEDIYPSINFHIHNPRARTRFLLDENGDKIVDNSDPTGYKRYSIWYIRLAYKVKELVGGNLIDKWLDFYVDEDMLIGKLSCQFQSNEYSTKYTSPLAGREFELIYHDSDFEIPANEAEGDSGIKGWKGDYEIIYDDNNGLILPTTIEGGLYPKGDKAPSEDNNIIRLFNIALPSEYTSSAQEELEKRALEDIEYWESDRNNYEFNSNPIAFKKDMPKLFIGRGVVYKNGDYQLNTRISKLVQKIDFPFEVEITVGNEEIKGSTTTMREQMQMIVSAMSNGLGGMSVEQFKKMLNIYGNSMFGSRFLSKLNDDTAAGLITFLRGLKSLGEIFSEGKITAKGGVVFGEFIDGLLGQGGRITADGIGTLRSLRIFEWLEVPEIRYNRITVNVGLSINSEGGGVIEKVIVDTDDDGNNLSTGSAYLKLEDGEYGAIVEEDLCMGLWHDFGGGNATETTDDRQGNIQIRGFKTIYFRITSVPEQDPEGYDNSDNHFFTYTLRSSLSGGNGIHPVAMLHFAQRGNPNDKGRQNLEYKSTAYTINLHDVTDWNFSPSWIYYIKGHLDNFTMQQVGDDGQTYTKTFKGTGVVMANAYIYGEIDKFERIGYRMAIDQSLGGTIAPSETETITCMVYDGYGQDKTYLFTKWAVTRDSGDEPSDLLWNAAHENVTNPFELSFSDLGLTGLDNRLSTMFRVTARTEDEKASATQTLAFN